MKYGLAVMAFIVVTFLAIIFFVNRSPSTDSNSKTPKISSLLDYKKKNAKLSVTVTGQMVGEDARRAIRVSVSPTERRLEILKGYEEYVESSQGYPNTQEAYEAFVEAVNTFGITKSKKADVAEPLSICPFGLHYRYEVSNGGDSVSNLWSVSCQGPNGTFNGNGPFIRQLFQMQIPDYDLKTSKVDLG